VVESGKTRTRGAIEALNRLEATGAQILGALLTKANEGGAGYGYGHYGYGQTYGRGKLKRNEILMIPRSGKGADEAGTAQGADA
jgi:Mrp family chromosome partitioning ATPase